MTSHLWIFLTLNSNSMEQALNNFVNELSTHLYWDYIIAVVAVGLLIKSVGKKAKWTWPPVILGAEIKMVYIMLTIALLVMVPFVLTTGGEFAKYLVSYCIATSAYEILIKRITENLKI